MEDEEYIYDDDYPRAYIEAWSPTQIADPGSEDDQPPPMPALGWDGFNPEVDERHRQLFFLEGNHRRPVLARTDNRSPFTSRLMAGSNRNHLGKSPLH